MDAVNMHLGAAHLQIAGAKMHIGVVHEHIAGTEVRLARPNLLKSRQNAPLTPSTAPFSPNLSLSAEENDFGTEAARFVRRPP